MIYMGVFIYIHTYIYIHIYYETPWLLVTAVLQGSFHLANARPHLRSALSREGGQRSHHGATEVRKRGVKGLDIRIGSGADPWLPHKG